MKSRMPERARTDLWEPWGSNPLGPPGPEPLLAVPHLAQQPIDVAPELFARGAFFLGQLG